MYTGYLVKYVPGETEGSIVPVMFKFLDTQLDLEELNVPNANMTKESGKAGSLSFSIPVTHMTYDDWSKVNTYVDVYEDFDLDPDSLIFSGRVYAIDADFNMTLQIECEGLLSILNDTLFPPKIHDGSLENLLNELINNHNSCVGADKQIILGNIDFSAELIHKEWNEYGATLDRLFDLADTFGGAFSIRKAQEGDEVSLYLDWLDVENDQSAELVQKVEFAENLLDVKQSEKSEGIITVLYPTGAELDTEENVIPEEPITENFGPEQDLYDSNDGITYETEFYPKQNTDVYLTYEIYEEYRHNTTQTLEGATAVDEHTWTIAGTPLPGTQVNLTLTYKKPLSYGRIMLGTLNTHFTWRNNYTYYFSAYDDGKAYRIMGTYTINATAKTVKIKIKAIQSVVTGAPLANSNVIINAGGKIKYSDSYSKNYVVPKTTKTIEWFDQEIYDEGTTIKISGNAVTIRNLVTACTYKGSIKYEPDPNSLWSETRTETFGKIQTSSSNTGIVLTPKYDPNPESTLEIYYEEYKNLGNLTTDDIPSLKESNYNEFDLENSPLIDTDVSVKFSLTWTEEIIGPGTGNKLKTTKYTFTGSITRSVTWASGAWVNFGNIFKGTKNFKFEVLGKLYAYPDTDKVKIVVTSIRNVKTNTLYANPKVTFLDGGTVTYQTGDATHETKLFLEKRTFHPVWIDQTITHDETTITIDTEKRTITFLRDSSAPGTIKYLMYDGYITYETDFGRTELAILRENVSVANVENKEEIVEGHVIKHTQGDKFIVDETAVEEFGWIAGTQAFTEIKDPEQLYEEGRKYLAGVSHSRVSVNVNAVDLVNAGYVVDRFAVDKKVHVVSIPHNIDRIFKIRRMDVDLFDRTNCRLSLDEETEGYIERTRHATNRALDIISHIYKNYSLNETVAKIARTQIEHSTAINQNEEEISLRAKTVDTQTWIDEATGQAKLAAQSYAESVIIVEDAKISLISEQVGYQNWMPFPYYRYEIDGSPCTLNGVAWTLQSNNSLKATGAVTSGNSYSQYQLTKETVSGGYAAEGFKLTAGSYSFSGCPANGDETTYFIEIQVYENQNDSTPEDTYYDYGEGIIFNLSGDRYLRISIFIMYGYTIPSAGLVFEPMLEVGDTIHTYLDPLHNAKKMVSEINITPQQIKIRSEHIDLEGAVSFSTFDNDIKQNFVVDNNVTYIAGGHIYAGTVDTNQLHAGAVSIGKLDNLLQNIIDGKDDGYIYFTAQVDEQWTVSGQTVLVPPLPNAWVTDNTGAQHTWTKKRPVYDTSSDAYVICWRSQQSLDSNGEAQFTAPYNVTGNTTISGDHIVTGTIAANLLSIVDVIATGGIKINNGVNLTNYMELTSSGIKICKNDVAFATFDTNGTSIGNPTGYNMNLNANALSFKYGSASYFGIDYMTGVRETMINIHTNATSNLPTVLSMYAVNASGTYSSFISLSPTTGIFRSNDGTINIHSGEALTLESYYNTATLKSTQSDVKLVASLGDVDLDASERLILRSSGGVIVFFMNGSGDRVFRPGQDYANKIALGTGTYKWSSVHATTLYGTVSTSSDRRLKKDIDYISEKYEKFFDDLKPKTFRLKENDSEIHIGAVAQDVKESLALIGLDENESGVIHKDEDMYYLRYDEFVMLNTWQIQKLKARVTELERKIENL